MNSSNFTREIEINLMMMETGEVIQLKTIIIEDEPLSKVYLNNLLTQFCPHVNVVSKVATVDEAIEAINYHNPHLIFLDIELHSGTGFEVLMQIKQPQFQVIFTTALDHYAIKIIEISGVDFLQKPIDSDELQKSINNVMSRRNDNTAHIALGHLLQTLQNNHIPLQLMLPLQNGREYVFINDVVRIEASGQSSILILRSGIKKVVDRNIKEYESLLNDRQFYRVHSQHIINLKEIKNVTEADEILMHDNIMVPVSAKKKDELMKMLDKKKQ